MSDLPLSAPAAAFTQPHRQPVASILVIDDNPINLRLLSKLLVEQGFEVRKALDGEMAIRSAQQLPPDLVLLDIVMPKLDGYGVCQQLKANAATADVPVIVLSALSASFDKVRAFRCGAADYVTKPFQFEEVLVRVQSQLSLRRAQLALRQLNAELEQRVQERTAQLDAAHARLMEMALQDRLTQLPNRVSFSERLNTAIARRQANEPYAVMFLDCDRFKTINDSLGHSRGDLLLVEVARRLQTIQQSSPLVEGLARFGGDEFALLLTGLISPDPATDIAQRILSALAQPFAIDGQDIRLNASIGIVWGSPDYTQPEHVLRDADTAMYRAKAAGKGQYRWFEPAMYSRAVYLLQLETDLRAAIDQEQFQVYYQPIVSLQRRVHQPIVGVEALVRWHHPQQGIIPPESFIALAEETGLIVQIGLQVLEQACKDLATWQRQRLVPNDFTLSVNLSARQLVQSNLVDSVRQIIEHTGILPGSLRLELTESAVIHNPAVASEVLLQLRQSGIQLSIDDFGTGYSSLSYLHQLPANCLKIDQSFVSPIAHDAKSLGIVPMIVSIAHTTGLQVVAEGIETEAQYQQLRRLGCEYGQGFFFYAPVSAGEVGALLGGDGHAARSPRTTAVTS